MKIFMCFILLFISNAGFATCSQYTSSVSVDVGEINVDNLTPDGSLLSKTENNNFISMFNCTGNPRSDQFLIGGLGSKVATYDGLQVFATNVPGIGIALGGDYSCYDYSGGQCQDGAPYPPVYIPAGDTQYMLGAYATTSHSVDWKSGYGIRVYKTGRISDGTFSGNVGHWFMSDAGAGSTWLNMTGRVTVTPSACTVLTPSTAATLGNHLTTEFTGINTTTATVDVPVKLSCPAGINVIAKLNAEADISTTQIGAIKLTHSEGLTASGVAVQIVDSNDNGVPIGGMTQFHPVVEKVVDFGWKARYLQTSSSPVTAGDANASATISINYE
jgi:type 1 fimbria pilin